MGVCLTPIDQSASGISPNYSRACDKHIYHLLGMGTRYRFICETGLSIAVNQSKTGPPSTRFGFLCMHRVLGGVIILSAPTSSLASQCLPSVTIKSHFKISQVWYPAHFHYAQKPSERRESGQGASI